jgi:hypothetical protein
MSTADEPVTQANPSETRDRTTPPASTAETSTSTTLPTSAPGAPTSTALPVSTPETPTRPYNFILALAVIILATIIFGIVMAIYRDVFTEGALVTTAMSTLFGIFGTVVGAYFGIKASSDTRDKLQGRIDKANETANRALAELPPEVGRRIMSARPPGRPTHPDIPPTEEKNT